MASDQPYTPDPSFFSVSDETPVDHPNRQLMEAIMVGDVEAARRALTAVPEPANPNACVYLVQSASDSTSEWVLGNPETHAAYRYMSAIQWIGVSSISESTKIALAQVLLKHGARLQESFSLTPSLIAIAIKNEEWSWRSGLLERQKVKQSTTAFLTHFAQ
jgi:hypothetical protein